MLTTTIFPGRYVQGKDARQQLGAELARFGQKGLVICDPFVHDTLMGEFEPYLDGVEVEIVKFTGECSDEEIARLVSLLQGFGGEFVVGLGGGKTIDTAKATAFEAKVPVAVVPTLAASDAPCSALSVIYTQEGEFKRYLLLPQNPNLVLVDTQIIAKAPVRLLVAGMGDALATWFEAESCQQSFAANMTGNLGSVSAYALARLCYDTLLQYGAMAKVANEQNVVTPALERVVEANTLLSGLGFESGGLAASHAIHNGLTVLEPTHGFLHGEKVAFGVLASLFLTDKPAETIATVYTFCESVGLPTTLGQIGLAGVTDAELMAVAEAACAEGETIHNEPRPVNAESVFAAMKAADAEGCRRQA
ncbi:glycerol dehydrogenase [Photobacterium sp. BZF1]|uniref:glycerol dehydrogenase n=1 Tax=Photobacterium sp. BZF1 TaxID=1904457 RepID=UPI001653B2B8|nr:glycerol dehydrogenase [Photobacterium sp. BZF1]MBC7002421.1 glycerol dehydrogenase [Photobacterium sp. BZF1]